MGGVSPVTNSGRRAADGTGGRGERQRGQPATFLSPGRDPRRVSAPEIIFLKSMQKCNCNGEGSVPGCPFAHVPKLGEGSSAGLGLATVYAGREGRRRWDLRGRLAVACRAWGDRVGGGSRERSICQRLPARPGPPWSGS